MDLLQEVVIGLIRKQVWHLRNPVITRHSHLGDELGLDSLDRVQLGIRIEQGLDIEIPDTELGQWRTVADVLDCVQRQLPIPDLPQTDSTS
jgi:acyl carrier protein